MPTVPGKVRASGANKQTSQMKNCISSHKVLTYVFMGIAQEWQRH